MLSCGEGPASPRLLPEAQQCWVVASAPSTLGCCQAPSTLSCCQTPSNLGGFQGARKPGLLPRPHQALAAARATHPGFMAETHECWVAARGH